MVLIDADALLKKILSLTITATGLRAGKRVLLELLVEYRDAILQVVKEQPTVDAVPVVHGWWVSDEGDVLFHCSECETQVSTSWDYDDLHWNFCPNCGARMDGGENNE